MVSRYIWDSLRMNEKRKWMEVVVVTVTKFITSRGRGLYVMYTLGSCEMIIFMLESYLWTAETWAQSRITDYNLEDKGLNEISRIFTIFFDLLRAPTST